MKKRILILLSMVFIAFSITACNYVKRKMPRVYTFFNKAYGFDENEYYYNTNEATYYQMNMEQNSLDDDNSTNAGNGVSIQNIADNNLMVSSNEDDKVDIDTKVSSDVNGIGKQQYIKNKYKHFGIIISGPSGVGKTTIINALKQRYSNTLDVSVSATTRMKREGEIHARDYYFLDIAMFKKLLAGGEFLEYANNYGNYYGTPKRNYFDAVDNGKDIIFSLSVDGMKNAIQHSGMDFVTIFIAPPSYDVLKQRLVDRNTETQAQINKRLSSARKEISSADGLYNYVVYNYNLENAIDMVNAIYVSEQRKREIDIYESETNGFYRWLNGLFK